MPIKHNHSSEAASRTLLNPARTLLNPDGQPAFDGALMVIGWREPVALPDWGIKSIKAKMDTGARTSAIHVDNIEQLPGNRVRFNVIVATASANGGKQCVPIETDVVRVSRVRPSTGKRQERLVVSTRMRLGAVEQTIELSLVCRHRMLCRLLLGRSALQGCFVIDPAHRRLLGPQSKKARSTPRVAP